MTFPPPLKPHAARPLKIQFPSSGFSNGNVMSRHLAVAVALLPLLAASIALGESRFNEALMNEELKIADLHFQNATRAVNGVGSTSPPSTGPDFETRIAAARQLYFGAYRSAKGLTEAAVEFGAQLAKKDAVLLWTDLLLYGVTGQAQAYAALARLDGGVVPGARREFNAWAEAIKEKADNGGGDFTQRLRRAQLMGAFPKHQAAYLAARNWAELERANIPLEPYQFAWMMVQRYPTAKAADVALPNYKAMSELFREESLCAAARKLIPLPRDERGRISGGLETVGSAPPAADAKGRPPEPMHVYAAWLTLVARDNPKRAFLINIPDLSGPYYFNDLVVDTGWVRTRNQYRCLLLAYGQERVDQAAEKCAKEGGDVMNALASADLDAYLRFILADGENLDTAQAVDARIAELTAQAGEAKVRDAATRVRDAQVAGQDLKQLGSGLGDPCSAIVSMLKPPASNNPWYRAWARFPVGSKAIYRKSDKTQLIYELESVTLRGVTVKHSRVYADPGQTSIEKIEYPAALDVSGLKAFGPAKTFMHTLHYSGLKHKTTSLYMTSIDPTPETFAFRDQSLPCTKRVASKPRSAYAETVWMCEQIPGGMVRVEVLRGNALAMGDLLVLEQFEGKPADDSTTAAKGICLNCAAALAADATQCPTCLMAIGADAEVVRIKKMVGDYQRQREEILSKAKQAAIPPAPKKRR
jgi:hypothetical protein